MAIRHVTGSGFYRALPYSGLSVFRQAGALMPGFLGDLYAQIS